MNIKGPIVIFMCFLLSNEVNAQGFLKFYDLGEEYTSQAIADIWVYNDTLYAQAIAIKQDQSQEYISLILSNNGEIISAKQAEEPGILSDIRWANSSEDIRVVDSLMQNRITFVSLDVNRNVLNKTSSEIPNLDFKDDIHFNQLMRTSNYWVLGCTVFSTTQFPVFFWFDVHSYNLIDIQYFDDSIASINEIAVRNDTLYGIAYNGDQQYDLVQISLDADLKFIQEVFEGENPSPSSGRLKIELDVGTEGQFIVGNWGETFPQGNQITYFEDEIVIIDPVNIRYGGNGMMDIIPTQDSGYICMSSSFIDDDFSGDDSRVEIISYINKNKEVIWSTKIKRFDEDGSQLLDFFFKTMREDEHFYYFPVTNANSLIGGILKISKLDGCVDSGCLPNQVVGYYPPPHKMVSHRHLYHIFNKATQEIYRYTYISPTIKDIGGTLLRSDEMQGNNWYSTGRQFVSSIYVLGEFEPPGDIKVDYLYAWRESIGERNYIYLPDDLNFLYLEIMQNDLTTFNDGREVRKITLQCFQNSVPIDSIPPVTWIEHIGDPNDIFNTYNACTHPGSEVVTCFYESGELMWSHPEYPDCNPTNVKELDSSEKPLYRIYPNPAREYITVSNAYQYLRIVDINGNLVFKREDVPASSSIDISELTRGMYYLYDEAKPKVSVSAFLKK